MHGRRVDVDVRRAAIREMPPTAVVGTSSLLAVAEEPKDALIRVLSSFAGGRRDDKRGLVARGVIRAVGAGPDLCVRLGETQRVFGTPGVWAKVRFHHAHRFSLWSV